VGLDEALQLGQKLGTTPDAGIVVHRDDEHSAIE
jgi:hypothetical protein